MYFNKLLLVSTLSYSVSHVAGLNVQLDIACVKTKCSLELNECAKEASSAPLDPSSKSYCNTVVKCMHEDIVDNLNDPMSCLDGIDETNISPMEMKVQSCMMKHDCITKSNVPDSPVISVPELRIKRMDGSCMSSKCSHQLTACSDDAVCKALFECLELHRNGDASRCSQHVDKLDGIQKSALQCGWSNKCLSGDSLSSEPTATSSNKASSVLNPVPIEAPTNVDLSFAQPVPVKSSFLEIKPLSFLSIQTATQAELQAAEAQADKQAKAAEAAWEQSKKNTDNLLAKVHTEIDTLNTDLEKTSSQEKADLALLEENRKKEDAELESAEKKLKELANTKVKVPSSFLEGFKNDDFLAPLRKAAEQARTFAKQLKDHSFFHPSDKHSSFLQNDASDRANKALSLAEQALKKLDSDIAAQKRQLAEQEVKAKKEEQEAEAQAAAELEAPAASFLQLGAQLAHMSTADLKEAEAKASKDAAAAKARWESSKAKTDALLVKVHEEIDHLNADLEKSALEDKHKIALLEKERKVADAKLHETDANLKRLETSGSTASSFVQTSDSADFLAPLRKAAEDAKRFAEQLKAHPFGGSSFVQTEADDRANKALSLAEKALRKLDDDIATEKKELAAEQEEAKREHLNVVDPDNGGVSFLQTGHKFDPLSPQALADWRDRFELQLQKAREAAGIHTPMHSSLAQLSLAPSFAENEQLKEDERLVERLENQYNQQMQKLKEDNAELLARAKEEMEKAKEEENRVKSQLSQVSFLETSHRYDPAKEEAHIRDLERKWIKEAESIVTPPQVAQQDSELQALIEQQRVKEAESEAQLEQMKAKLNKDIEILNKDIATNSMQASGHGGVSFLQTGVKGPAEAALQRAEADLQKLKQQLREETAKLNAMHFDTTGH